MTMDCLIVLGAPLNPQGKPGRVARMRLTHALEVWRARCPGALILITGGFTGGHEISEARAMAEWALNWVEANWGPEMRDQLSPCILLEEASRNTAASARHTLPLIKELNFQSVGLVSDTLHIHRAHYLFRRNFRRHRIALHPCPVPGVFRHYWRAGRYLWLSKMALREGGAWLKALGRRALGK